MREELLIDYYDYVKDLLDTESVKSMNQFIQHGNITCLQHSLGVGIFSLIFVRNLGIPCNERALVRGALLHDYFLYDWHEKEDNHKWHGFTHAKTALNNATRDFELNHIEKDIIGKHMWPLNIMPPTCREAWVVNIIDTYCSTLETVSRIPLLRFLEEIIINAGKTIAI
ncbi:MAG TPA: HD domain-containing protein [Candidatus Merdenecus merdavium]|nr:HD domain-containing protein [Candidatus Merdenecus merdavium]